MWERFSFAPMLNLKLGRLMCSQFLGVVTKIYLHSLTQSRMRVVTPRLGERSARTRSAPNHQLHTAVTPFL